MDLGQRRQAGAWAKVCLVVCFVLVGSAPRVARAEPIELPEAPGELGVVIYPAAEPGPHGVTLLLHGMCGEPLNTCRYFAERVTRREHLVCPRANLRCPAGGASWAASGFERPIERAVSRAEAALGEAVDTARGRTLIGYSLGAYRALELAQHGAGKYPRVMLLGARVFPSLRRLHESGVARLLLGAGAFDVTYEHMQREAERLARGGLEARFLGLGRVGHALTPSFDAYLPLALDWLSGP